MIGGMNLKRRDFFLCLVLVLLFFACLFWSQTVAVGVSMGVALCLQVLIPSLFIFLVLSELLQPLLQRLSPPKPLAWFCRHLLHIDPYFGYIFLLGMVGGYPIGVKLIADAHQKQMITKQDANFLLRFCIMTSPAFLISGVARVLWQNVWLGVLLYSIQVIVAIAIAFFTGLGRFVHCQSDVIIKEPPPFSRTLVSATRNSTVQMGVICGFVLLFCGLFAFLDALPLSDTVLLFIKGLLEVTAGSQLTASLPVFFQPFAVVAFTAFGGLCVHMQLLALSGGSMQYLPFLCYRLLFTGICLLLWGIVTHLFPPVLSCFSTTPKLVTDTGSQNPIYATLLLLLCCMLLLLFDKKINRSNKDYSTCLSHDY